MADVRRFLRDNLVFVAAFALPAAVAALFVLATAIPTWTVPLPQHDLVLRIDHYQSPPPDVFVEFAVRDGRLEADVRPVVTPGESEYGHHLSATTGRCCCSTTRRGSCAKSRCRSAARRCRRARSRTVVVEALAGRRMVAGDTAPDGYQVASLNTRRRRRHRRRAVRDEPPLSSRRRHRAWMAGRSKLELPARVSRLVRRDRPGRLDRRRALDPDMRRTCACAGTDRLAGARASADGIRDRRRAGGTPGRRSRCARRRRRRRRPDTRARTVHIVRVLGYLAGRSCSPVSRSSLRCSGTR